MTSTFGVVRSRDQIEQQIINTLQTPPQGGSQPLIVYYLAELERQHGLPPRTLPTPPGPSSYRGGLDFDTFEEEWAPQITVLCQPTGDAERYDDENNAGIYGQWYEIRVAASVTGEDEDAARVLADRYGAALALLLAEHGGFGTWVDSGGNTTPYATKTVLVSLPRTEFPDPRIRRLTRSTVVVRSYIEHLVNEGGPTKFNLDPYTTSSPWPTITTVEVDLLSQEIDGTDGPQSGVTVSDSTGHVLITE